MNTCARVCAPLVRAFSILALPRLKHTHAPNRSAGSANLVAQSVLNHHSRANNTRLFSHSTTMATSEGNTGAVVVYVTVPSQEVAEKLAALLVNPDHRLAACVNIVPGLTSIYWWEGKVNKDAELLLMIKTQTHLVPKLTDVVKSNHPYDECEVISLPITGGSSSYIKWIHDSTSA